MAGIYVYEINASITAFHRDVLGRNNIKLSYHRKAGFIVKMGFLWYTKTLTK